MTFRILVADHSITIQKIVAMAFENEDATVEGVGNGQEAFEMLNKFKPDIVLADVEMPDLSGFDLSRKIKESSEFRSTSVLLLASDFEEFDDALFIESKADDHITKPFKSEDIVRKVNELLESVADENTEERVEDEYEEDVLSLSEADMVKEETILGLPEDDHWEREEEADEHSEVDEEEVVTLDLPEELEEPPVDEESGFSEEEAREREDEISIQDAVVQEEVRQREFEEEVEEVQGGASDVLEREEDVLESPFEISRTESSELESFQDEVIEENLGIGFGDSEEQSPEAPAVEQEKPQDLETAEEEDQEETLEDLVGKIDALSKKADEIQEKDAKEKLFTFNAIDEVIKEVNALKEYSSTLSGEKNGSSGQEDSQDNTIAEIRYKSEEQAEELEEAFHKINQERKSRFQDSGKISRSSWEAFAEEKESIAPEPEDLLGRLATHHSATSLENPMSDIKNENDSRLSETDQPQRESVLKTEDSFVRGAESGRTEDEDKPFSEIMAKEIREILEKSLDSSLEKEISGLSEKIVRSVEDVVREITPGIARSIIEKEIDKIKRMDDA